jgi:predicted nucleic acid-binding protein
MKPMPGDPASACFIDTNVWRYAFIESGETPKSVTARALIENVQPVVSTQVINEVCVNLLKRTGSNEEQIGQLVESFYAEYSVVELGRPVLLAASQLRGRYSLSFWDSLIVAAALGAGVEILYSEDFQHGLNIDDRLRVLNPFVES